VSLSLSAIMRGGGAGSQSPAGRGKASGPGVAVDTTDAPGTVVAADTTAAPGTTLVPAIGSSLAPKTGLGVSTRSGGLGATFRASGELGESMRPGLAGSSMAPETGFGVSTRSGGLGEAFRTGGLGEFMRSGLSQGAGLGD
jgi:hypothetical protein